MRGAARRFLLSAPAHEEGDDPLPLVLDFHGLAEGADIHAEMTRLGVKLGADPATFAGLAGVGDLVLTCTGSHSRNRSERAAATK